MKASNMKWIAACVLLATQGTALASDTTNHRWGPWFGGTAGSGYLQECAPGHVAVGFRVRSGAETDQVQLLCALAISPSPSTLGRNYTAGSSGGDGGGESQLLCASGYAVSTIYGRSGGRLDQLGIVCRRLDWTWSYTGPSAGGTGGSNFFDSANPGEFVTAIGGRVDGNWGTNGTVSGISVRYSTIVW